MIKVGIIGLEFGRNVHIPGFLNSKKAEIVAIAGTRLSKARDVAAEFKIPNAYDNYREILQDPSISAISVAVPPNIQGEILPQALAAKKHIFLEKPLGCSSKVGSELADLADASEIVTVMDYEFPQLESWKKMKSILSSGSLGKPRHANVDWNLQTYSNKKNLVSWKTTDSEFGGTIYNFGSHVFFYLEWLLGPISGIFHRSGSSVQQLTELMVDFSSGLSGNISLSSNTPFCQRHRIEIFLDRGRLLLENSSKDYLANFDLTVFSEAGETMFLDRAPNHNQDGRIDVVGRLIEAFLRQIQKLPSQNETPNLRDGARVELLTETAMASSKSGKWSQLI